MKKYVILALNITDMGGVHQYCRNKCDAVKRYGYKPLVFSGTFGDIYIPELKEFSNNIYPELRYPPYCFTKKRVNRVINKISDTIDNKSEEVVIECLTIANSEWGELIAKKIKAKSVAFILDEQYDTSNQELDFLKFKHDRKELAGIKKQSLCILFGNKYLVPDEEQYSISALCTNVVADYDYNVPFSKTNDTVVIGSIGRLDKGYVLQLITDLSTYFRNNVQQKYILCLVGGAPNKNIITEIKNIISTLPNVDLFITGYIYPIPKNLLNTFDVSIGTSGGANITALYERIPTISVDTHSSRPIGILNYTTKESTYANSETHQDLSYYLDEILKNHSFDYTKDLGMKAPADTFKDEVERVMKEFVDTSFQKEYYDVAILRPVGLKYLTYSIIGKMFGANVLTSCHQKLFSRVKFVFKLIRK